MNNSPTERNKKHTSSFANACESYNTGKFSSLIEEIESLIFSKLITHKLNFLKHFPVFVNYGL